MRFSDFRALVPSWLFFDDVGSGSRIQVRWGTRASAMGEWQEALVSPPRKAWHLLHNPKENLRLYTLSLLERLASEEDPSVYTDCMRLLKNQTELKEAAFFQFRIRERDEDSFVSKVEEL